MDGSIKIMLEPSKRKERLGGIEYRVFVGRTNTGVELEMLGLFRITDPLKREEFYKAVGAIRIDDPAPVTLLSNEGLISP